MRPWTALSRRLCKVDGRDVLPAAAALSEGAAVEIGADDFLRGGNSSSVAAEISLVIDAEVGLHEALSAPAGIVSEYEIVLGGFTEGWRQVGVYFLVVRVFGGKDCFAG